MGNDSELKPGLSVGVTTCDNEKTIGDVLSSVSFADEIVIVDSGSCDATLDIARRFTGDIIHQDFLGYGSQKNFLLDACGREWVLILDSDEALTPGLAEEVRAVVSGRMAGYQVYSMPRLSRFIDRWMRHGGWYPDRVVRLLRNGAGRFTEHPVHDRLATRFPVGRLSADLLHFTYESVSDYARRQDRYSSLVARWKLDSGRRPRVTAAGLAWDLMRKFLEVYVLKRGFLDGQHGFVVACLASYAVFLRQAKIWRPEPVREPGISREQRSATDDGS